MHELNHHSHNYRSVSVNFPLFSFNLLLLSDLFLFLLWNSLEPLFTSISTRWFDSRNKITKCNKFIWMCMSQVKQRVNGHVILTIILSLVLSKSVDLRKQMRFWNFSRWPPLLWLSWQPTLKKFFCTFLTMAS